MNKEIQNLKDLFVEQGRELFDATRKLQGELPGIQKQVTNQNLQTLLQKQLKSAKEQNHQIQNAFTRLNLSPEGETSECCESIIRQTRSLIKRSPDSHVRDAAIIGCIQRLNHFNITSLGSLAAYAKNIGQETTATSLHNALEIEKAIDKDLSKLALETVNREAFVVSSK